ncbi:endonuclease [Nocardioides sp. zg-ZUI104]|uniref:endonuclease n=1 Tax=Nocardioides faecalis TaxID=2803858 RepID=UPI001BCC7488|nr:endonuclease [Nocardioides faecalis]MBS4752245.1 endonuclease [Nocardioides faecalis]
MASTLGALDPAHPRRRHLGSPYAATSVAVVAVVVSLLAALLVLRPAPADAASLITVASAISSNSGTQTVRGYVVGQPTATNTVVTSNYPNDYALAIADSATESSTSRMLYVQIPSAHRSAWGLRSNPDLKGVRIDVTGSLGAYFSQAGMTGTTAFALASGSTPTPTPTATPTSPPPTADPGGYYAPVAGKTGAALHDALHDLIDEQTKISYSTVWDALKVTDADPANSANVLTFYSGVSMPKSANGGNSGNWNREHVWPQSHGDFGTSIGPGTDLHHLRPETVSVNSTRSNKDFDNGGSAVSGCSDCWTDSDSFEPRDSVKGDVARMVFYMAVRYEGDDGFADLEVNDTVNGTTRYLGRLSVLKAWHRSDPPDARERQRNEVIYTTYQRNRNPFIDHPEWVTSIWGS